MPHRHNNPVPVAVCLVNVQVDGITLLLAVRRGHPPAVGGLAFPGGYVDEGESVEVAASRELEEETSLVLPPSIWRPLETRITAENRLLVFMQAAEPVQAEALAAFQPNREVQALALVAAGDQLAFPLHDAVLKKYGPPGSLSSSRA